MLTIVAGLSSMDCLFGQETPEQRVPLFPFRQDGENGKWGYINRKGEVVIRPRFDEAKDFFDGRAYVEEGKRRAYIDVKGRVAFAVPEDWGLANSFSGGVASFADAKYGFIDPDGNIAVQPRYDLARDFSDGVAWVNVGHQMSREGSRRWQVIDSGKWGLVDGTGRELIEPKFSAVEDFSDGMAKVRLGDSEAVIDKKGRTAFQVNENSDDSTSIIRIRAFSEGLASATVSSEDGPHTGFVDKTGKFVIPPQYRGAGEFSGGQAIVVVGKVGNKSLKRGWIDRRGRFVVQPRVLPGDGLIAGFFSEALAQVAIGRRFVYVDRQFNIVIDGTTGERRIPGPFSDATDFRGGLARVHIGGKVAYLPGMRGASVPDSHCRWYGGTWYYINRKGQVVHRYCRDDDG